MVMQAGCDTESTSLSCVHVWRNDGVEIIMNDQTTLTMPSYVAFADTGCLIGSSTTPVGVQKDIVFDVHRLIGRKYNDIHAEVETDMSLWSFKEALSAEDRMNGNSIKVRDLYDIHMRCASSMLLQESAKPEFASVCDVIVQSGDQDNHDDQIDQEDQNQDGVIDQGDQNQQDQGDQNQQGVVAVSDQVVVVVPAPVVVHDLQRSCLEFWFGFTYFSHFIYHTIIHLTHHVGHRWRTNSWNNSALCVLAQLARSCEDRKKKCLLKRR